MDRANPTKHVTEKLQMKCTIHINHIKLYRERTIEDLLCKSVTAGYS